MRRECIDTRERTCSAWHRRDSTRRFAGLERARRATAVDQAQEAATP